MKLVSLAFLAMASTAVAEQNFTWLMITVLEGVIGSPNNANCIAIFESKAVEAYETALPNADTQIQDVVDTTVKIIPGTLGSGNLQGAQTYSFTSTSDNRCTRCKSNLFSVGNETDEAAFEEEFKLMLDASACTPFHHITNVTVTYLPMTSVEQVEEKPMLREQEYKLKMTTVLEGVSGNPNNKPCIETFEETVVTAYAVASSDANAQIEKVYDTTVKYGDAAKTNHLRSGPMGTFSYISSADNRCRDCLSGFFNIQDHLQAIGTQMVFEATLKKLLIDSTCAAFSTLDSVSVLYEPRDSDASHEIVLQGAVMEHA